MTWAPLSLSPWREGRSCAVRLVPIVLSATVTPPNDQNFSVMPSVRGVSSFDEDAD
jgi:hypothetical protein